MKKIILSLSLVFVCLGVTVAQDKKQNVTGKGVETPAPKSSLALENMAFANDSHDFANIPEGPNAEYEFHFKNTGKEPIIVERVQASCGCTTPSYSKDPVLPGKEGTIKASYGTNGRPGPFTKTITVVSNAGTKVLTIKGSVEKAPSTSVPENTSMIKTN